MKVDLTGRVAAVTGGGGVLCRVLARALAAQGARVALLDLRPEAAAAGAEEIAAAGGQALGLACDVLDRESVAGAERTIAAELGPVDILVNGAGGNNPAATTTMDFLDPDLESPGGRTFFDLDPQGVDATFRLNFLGTLIPSQVFGRSMAGRRRGTVVNISSMNALVPLTRIPAYSGAKAAVSNFTRWLAVHLSRCGIRVNAIAPGFFLTDQNRALLVEETGEPTARGGRIIDHTPLGRYGRPEELQGTLLWLVDDEAAGFVTGTVIPVDGGFSAYSGV